MKKPNYKLKLSPAYMGALADTRAHWHLMIDWARKQPPDAEPDADKMEAHLGESWYGDYCPLCQLTLKHANSCKPCPLYRIAGVPCDDLNHPSKWVYLSDCATWRGWLLYANQMIAVLNNIALNATMEEQHEDT